MKKLITFSLWGDDPKYCEGALRNAELAEKVYPGWTCRFYVGQEPDSHNPHNLIPDYRSTVLLKLLNMDNVEVVPIDEPANWTGMFWRFYPASEDDVDVFISRDCDSRLSEREAAAVDEWLDSPRLIHVMRDHPHHSAPMMGGMWGAKRGALPYLQEQLAVYIGGNFWQVDQNFLREIVWPANCHKVMAHDDWNRFPGAAINKFCPPREGDDFVGAIIGAHEERVHPEHHAML